jgi:hypothetical protein
MSEDKQFKSFDDMEFLSFELMKGIFDYGFQSPSRIQNLTIKNIYDGYDIISLLQFDTITLSHCSLREKTAIKAAVHHSVYNFP